MDTEVTVGAKALIAVLACASLVAQQAAQPDTRKLVLENEHVRVWRVQLPPGAATAAHRHERALLLAGLSEGKLTHELGETEYEDVMLYRGMVSAPRAGAPHGFRNEGKAQLDLIEIEVLTAEKLRPLKPQPSGKCNERGCWSEERLFEAGGVQVLLNTLDASKETPAHQHLGPHLALAITALLMKNEPQGKPAGELNLDAGSAVWVPPGPKHTLTNIGKKPAVWLVVEFTPNDKQ